LLFEPNALVPLPKVNVLFPKPLFPNADVLEFPKPVLPKVDELLFPKAEERNEGVLVLEVPNAPNDELLLLLPNAEVFPNPVLTNVEILLPKLELFPKVVLPNPELPKAEELLLPNPEFPNAVLDEFPNPVLPNADVLLFPNNDVFLLLLLLPNALEEFPNEKEVLPNMVI